MDDQRVDWLASAFRSAAEDSRPREDCPAPELIWSAVHRELPAAERLAIVDHVADCPACAEAWRLAHEIAPLEASTAPSNRRATWRRSAGLQAAAAAVLVAGLVAAILMLRPTTAPEVRDPGAAVLRSELGEGAALARDDFRLRWSGGPRGSRYDLTVTTRELDVVVDVRGLEHAEYRIDPARLASLPAGTRLLWRVIARAPDGLTAASPSFEVSVR
jgi:hypothetical protein